MQHSLSIPKVPTPYRFPRGTQYVALRSLTVNGVALKAGDLLPADSPLYQMQRRLETLVRTRYLAPKVMVTVENETPTETAASPEPTLRVDTPDLSAMTGPQLMRKCKELGLNAYGNKAQLRKRIRDALG